MIKNKIKLGVITGAFMATLFLNFTNIAIAENCTPDPNCEAITSSTGITILPSTCLKACECDDKYSKDGKVGYLVPPSNNTQTNEILACAIKTGDIHIWMIPYYIKYLAEFLIGIAGILCMLFIVIGGYQYTFAGVVEAKEKGKMTLIYAIIGLALVLLSWTIVNAVLFLVTS